MIHQRIISILNFSNLTIFLFHYQQNNSRIDTHMRNVNIICHFVGNFNTVKMYISIILKESKEKIIVPFKWIFSLNVARCLNNGISRNKPFVIFYSPNRESEPDFKKPLRIEFDENEEACYKAHFLKSHGKYKNYLSNQKYSFVVYFISNY